MTTSLINLAYLVASALFILGLKGLAHPRTAVRGNLLGATGMLIAVVVTLLSQEIIGFGGIILGMLLGSTVGAVLAYRIAMTAMPQLVALLNGFGGLASVLVAGAALVEESGTIELQMSIATAASGLIGAVTFWGSLVAFGKLQEVISGNPVLLPGRHALNAALLAATLALAAGVAMHPEQPAFYWGLVLLASVLGVLAVIPIGGADMPVVISLLNSYSGLAACATGFVLNNTMLIIAGSLVGASGLILTRIMCDAMNRSLANVLFGGLGASPTAAGGGKGDDLYAGRIKKADPEEIAMLLDIAQRVIIVPGYGLAVSQAQHSVRDLAELLESRGIHVDFAIHPVAGRMPGHMNVLLAEADIPYEKLLTMEEVNPLFEQADVAIVIGANDVVNPAARTDPNSPIAGMPILDVDKARTVVVVKRSLSPGFAGIPNPLFAADNTLMYFADGKKALVDLIAALKG
ncbi:NAD(P)(+) transhydrogenase (Re/Si-specific) subunit beta [Tautonia sociabilis]|uniref:NAD(P) transhydrogenase subunit beta n=1 Tax=Tautonia sociabilis TaxID=2080755 RepID=A0A432MDZ5_9BACT|nr:NAD(P)(+) transhydrogenase (Re/Si-specific) subunit beta [Tautonia sociabilis]RUL83320.1 NAD(P)(+) transhydrogenase (Re/Si-specific) subunit beta [Tautonia sociabilis]